MPWNPGTDLYKIGRLDYYREVTSYIVITVMIRQQVRQDSRLKICARVRKFLNLVETPLLNSPSCVHSASYIYIYINVNVIYPTS
jgi:hypothetical protein